MDKNTQQTLVVDFEHNDTNSQQNLFTHLTNLLQDLEERQLTIEVVAYGPAIEMVTTKTSQHLEDIQKLQEMGVLFKACHNAMEKHNITEDELIDGVAVVPSGIGHIVKTQLEGAVYIKA